MSLIQDKTGTVVVLKAMSSPTANWRLLPTFYHEFFVAWIYFLLAPWPLRPLYWWHFLFSFERLMSAPFMKVPTQSRTSLRFAKAILSSPRICPWFGLTSVVLQRSSSVSALCAFPYRPFPGRFSARLRRCTASFQPWPVTPKILPFLNPTRLVGCRL
jgi:hypothetical protein